MEKALFEIGCCECNHHWTKEVEEDEKQQPTGTVICPDCKSENGFAGVSE